MTMGLIFIMFTVNLNWFMYPGVIFLAAGSFTLLVKVSTRWLAFYIFWIDLYSKHVSVAILLQVTNHPLSQLVPKATSLIMAFGQCIFQFSNSVFRLWQVLFDAGVPFKVIVLANLSFTLVHWMRTLFLMPLGHELIRTLCQKKVKIS